MAHPQVFAIWIVEVAPTKAPVLPHEGEAPNDVAHGQAGVVRVMVVVVVELVVKRLQGCEGGVGAALADRGVSATIAQG